MWSWTWLLFTGCNLLQAESNDFEVEERQACDKLDDCCDHGLASVCGGDGFCDYNPYCAEDPECFGSRWGVCDGGFGPISPPHTQFGWSSMENSREPPCGAG